MKLLLIFTLFFLFSLTGLSQENNDEYKAFMQNGIEFKTNGKDTIMIVDPMPEFEGGKQGLVNYLRKSIRYPKSAREKNIEGKVLVSFTIGADGKVRDCKIVKNVSPKLDKEALRVIKKMPKWKPGEQHGRPIPVRFTIPINFALY